MLKKTTLVTGIVTLLVGAAAPTFVMAKGASVKEASKKEISIPLPTTKTIRPKKPELEY